MSLFRCLTASATPKAPASSGSWRRPLELRRSRRWVGGWVSEGVSKRALPNGLHFIHQCCVQQCYMPRSAIEWRLVPVAVTGYHASLVAIPLGKEALLEDSPLLPPSGKKTFACVSLDLWSPLSSSASQPSHSLHHSGPHPPPLSPSTTPCLGAQTTSSHQTLTPLSLLL